MKRLFTILFLLVGYQFSYGQSFTLSPTADNTIYGGSTTLSNGAGDHMFAGSTASGRYKRALVRFDLSTLPECIQIDSVALVLNMSRTPTSTGKTVSLHKLTTNWGEGTSDAPGNEGSGTTATTGDCTWEYNFYSSSSWTTDGGDYISTASGSLSVGGTGSYTFKSAGMLQDVQNWILDPSTNFGWIMIGDESGSSTSKRFDTRESSNPPKLIIYYTDLRDIIINEVDYDQPSTDASEFIEIFNRSASTVNLDSFTVIGQNGATDMVYRTMPLPNYNLASGDYYVICGNSSTVPNCDLVVSPSTNLIQNGAPDGLGLKYGTNGLLCDALSYEGNTTDYTEYSGVGIYDDPSEFFSSISRVPNGKDTDSNNVDFKLVCASPGLANFTYLGSCALLPVDMQNFNVYTDGGITYLKWSTAVEHDNYGFFVQMAKEDPANGFEVLGFVESTAENGFGADYQFEVGELSRGIYHFRLEQRDFDGTVTYTRIITLMIMEDEIQQVFIENPIEDVAKVYIRPTYDQHVNIQVVSMTGALVTEINAGMITADNAQLIEMDMKNVSAGMYLIRVIGENFTVSEQVVVQ